MNKFITHKPQRVVTKYKPVLNDLESHMPAQHQYRDSDEVTWAHETIHGINSSIRNVLEKPWDKNGFYLLENLAFVCEDPKDVSLRQVANKIPTKFRNHVYQLYMVQQQSGWNDKPTYIFDELTAYIVGSKCGIEYDVIDRATDSFKNGLSMLLFASFFVKMTKINYTPYMMFILGQCKDLVVKLPKSKLFYDSVMEYI